MAWPQDLLLNAAKMETAHDLASQVEFMNKMNLNHLEWQEFVFVSMSRSGVAEQATIKQNNIEDGTQQYRDPA